MEQNNLAKLTIGVGIILVILGIISYIVSGMASVTALIPSILGGILTIFGILIYKKIYTKISIYVSGIISIVGLLGSLRGIPQTITLISGGEVPRPLATISQTVTVILCFILIIAIIKNRMEK